MINFGLTFSKFDRQVKELVKRTRKLNTDAQSQVGPRSILIRRLSEAYFKELKTNLTSGKYPSGGKPLNTRYADWKLRNYGFLDPWFLEGDLFRNIVIFETQGVRAVGIPKGIKAGGKSWLYDRENQSRSYNSREITYYGYLNEFGSPGGRIPARPVFGPTLADFVNGKADAITKEAAIRVFKKWEIKNTI